MKFLSRCGKIVIKHQECKMFWLTLYNLYNKSTSGHAEGMWLCCDKMISTSLYYIGNFDSILTTLGCNRNELTAVHLVKSYYMPSLLHGCDGLFSRQTIIKWMSYGIIPLERFFSAVGEKVSQACFIIVKHCHYLM